ncbi:hypothetical protein BO86DRAFT_458341 [Aspergillus japonicus CBS 114.51]|uniref:P-loop containing nucleoside triphosphate hydrolase protein n=1 Tax=Aspergillus japonicus CBS 114.51 TaxID=1448312 RepID=A0A8T8WRZ1_ASPJA|nr:hypothetical protein BO86DRAFT_458341 [Aspergillus japonicus CBS 114.51]RAH78628.1 hypothetical protein BO86DRAFT_458341 [Aspergillus japonicus CBS 114.51]
MKGNGFAHPDVLRLRVALRFTCSAVELGSDAAQPRSKGFSAARGLNVASSLTARPDHIDSTSLEEHHVAELITCPRLRQDDDRQQPCQIVRGGSKVYLMARTVLGRDKIWTEAETVDWLISRGQIAGIRDHWVALAQRRTLVAMILIEVAYIDLAILVHWRVSVQSMASFVYWSLDCHRSGDIVCPFASVLAPATPYQQPINNSGTLDSINPTASCVLADHQLGPQVSVHCRSFDFTVAFEESILSIPPSVLFIGFATIRIAHLYKETQDWGATFPKTEAVLLQSLAAVFGLLQLSLLVIYARPQRRDHQPLGVAALALGVADSVFVGLLSYLEHERAISPPGILLSYLLSTLLDAARLRSLWLLDDAIATGAYWRLQLRFITTLRGTLISALYRKALQLSDVEARKATVALMSTDVEMACTGLEQLHEVYFSLLQIGIATWLLEWQVGAAPKPESMAGERTATAEFPNSRFCLVESSLMFSRILDRCYHVVSQRTSPRDFPISVHSASKYRTIFVWVMGLAYAPSAISPVVTLAIYAAIRSSTWASSSLISSPLVAVFQLVPMVVAALSCLDRIEGFLASPTHADYRISPSTTGTHVESEKQAMESVRPSSDQKSGGGSRFALTIRNATFSYPGSSSVVLQDITVNIPLSQLTLILGPDLDESIEGDHTEVGSNGVTLSGGQKQRLVMARAVYARKELFVLDDSFSALDPQTEGKVAQRLLGPQGMMRENGQTVVVASSGERLLPYADLVILLGINGRIRAQGSPRELASYLNIPSKGNNIPDHRKVSVYGSYFRSMGFWRGTGLWALLIFQTFFSKFPNKSPLSMASSYAKYIGVYSFFQVVSMIFTLLAALVLGTDVFRIPMSAFSTIEVGSVVNKCSRDLGTGHYYRKLSQLLSLRICRIPSPPGHRTRDLEVLSSDFKASPRYGHRSEKPSAISPQAQVVHEVQLCVTLMSVYFRTHFLETISGLCTIRAFGWQHSSQRSHEALLQAAQRPYYQRFMVQRWLNLVLDMVAAGVAILVVGLAIRLQTRSTLVGLALVNVISLNETLQSLILQWAVMEISLGSISRLEEFTIQARADRGSEQQGHPAAPEFGGLWPSHGSIEYKSVTARYQENSFDVLKNISLSIPAGSKVGVCGRTGSGKSTFISGLFQMITLTSGSIFIDGVDIATLDPEIVRSHLIGISQHSYIMPGVSVRDNLTLGCVGPSEDSQLIAALQKVNLWDLVSARGGLSAFLDNETLSAGQSQLFSCARALLRSGSVVVLDEPASSLTAETADLIQRVVLEKFKQRTVIVVMH